MQLHEKHAKRLHQAERQGYLILRARDAFPATVFRARMYERGLPAIIVQLRGRNAEIEIDAPGPLSERQQRHMARRILHYNWSLPPGLTINPTYTFIREVGAKHVEELAAALHEISKWEV